jgi:hypothetical protein
VWQALTRLSPSRLLYSGTAMPIRWLLHNGSLYNGSFMWLNHGTAVQQSLTPSLRESCP